MTEQERQALVSIALLAAFADDHQNQGEREEVRRVAQALDGELEMAALHHDILLKKTTLASACAQLSSRELKQLAYEFAVGVAEADGLRSEQESAFLASLAGELGLDDKVTRPLTEGADALASVPLEPGVTGAADIPSPTTQGDPALSAADRAVDPEEQAAAEVASGKIFIGTADSSSKAITGAASAAGAAGSFRPDEAGMDKTILDAAILNGALELLPQSLASLAIIPLQMKLVYRIGKAHGYELDREHVKELLATMGAGVTGQYLEGVGRKLLGGLLGMAAGRMSGGLASGATGMAFSFATTWAIGQVARRYYAGGRNMNAGLLRETFESLVQEGRTLQERFAPQIASQSQSLDIGKLVDLVRQR